MDRQDPRLIEYLLGTASKADRAAVEAASADPEIAAELQALREVLGLVGAQGAQGAQGARVKATESLRDRIVRSVVSEDLAGFVDRAAVFLDIDPLSARAVLAQLAISDSSAWVPSGIAGIRIFELTGGPRLSDAERCVALHMEPGSHFPEHHHQGDEWGLVLRGQLLQNDGRRFGPGDLVHQAEGSSHAFGATRDSEVIQLVVLRGGIEFL